MPKLIDNVHILFSPLTQEIVVATPDKRRSTEQCFVAAQKAHRTGEFVEALIRWCPPGFEQELKFSDGKTYVVRIEETAGAAPDDKESE